MENFGPKEVFHHANNRRPLDNKNKFQIKLWKTTL